MTTRARGSGVLSARTWLAVAIGPLVAGCTHEAPVGDDDVPDDARRIDAAPADPDAALPGPDARPDAGSSVFGVFESGTRLKMRVGTTPDGARTFLGWRDTMRNEDCGFLTAADGQLRCLPATVVNYSPDLFWADSACTTTRLAYASAGCTVVGNYARAVGTCAPFRFTIYMLGAHHTGTVYVKAANTCTVYTGANEYYVLGGEVAPASFVPATESLE